MKKTYENIKKSKPFKISDIFIYIFLVVLIFSFFLFFVILPSRKSVDGFNVLLNDEIILVYNYQNQPEINQKYLDKIIINSQNDFVYITVFTDENNKDYNLIEVDLSNKTVRMKDANCSPSHDCTLFLPLKDNKGSIICLPHNLEIVPVNFSYTEPVIGG